MKTLLTGIVLLISGAWLVGTRLCHAQETPSMDNNRLLLRACEAGNVAEVNRLLNAGADPDVADSNHKTALMFAAEYEDTSVTKQGISSQAMVKALLNRGAKVNIISDNEETALMKAVAKNNDATVKLLLDKGAITHVQVVDKNTVLLASGNLSTREAVSQLRLHVGDKVAKAEWRTTNKQGATLGSGWTRPTNVHYQNMLALLKAVALPTKK